MNLRHRRAHLARQQQARRVERFGDALVDQLPLGQRRFAQHIAGHVRLDARMADAQPQPPEIRRAELRLHVLQPVVPTIAATLLELHLAGLDVQLIVNRQDFFWRDLEEARQRRHRLARQIHEGHRLQQPNRLRCGVVHAGDQAVVTALDLQARAKLAGEFVNPPEAGVVAGVCVFRAGVAEAYKETNHGWIIRGCR